MQRHLRGATGVVAAVLLLGATGLDAALPRPTPPDADVPLYSAGVALAPDGSVSLVGAGQRPAFHPDSRVLRGAGGPAARRAAERQARWLAAGDLPGRGTTYDDMSRAALLDLETLLLPNGAAVAGWSSNWRYVWPRDAAFVAAALARTGHADDAFSVLTFLRRVQEEDGRFQARYLPTATGEVPDGRGVQLDGAGWVLWGTRQWADSFGAAGAPGSQLLELAPLVRASTESLVRLVDRRNGLPPTSSDYWERDESALTLGTAAPILAGLRAAPALLVALGDSDLAREARSAARRLDRGIRRTFGPSGYPRSAGGDERDAAITFLAPPFAPSLRADVARAWSAAQHEMRQPAGGLSPGVGWKKDGISWTPETALFALTAAASGRTARALHWLTWLEGHRTVLGSLPEKVTAGGKPAAVAPLAWTAALVVLALDELEDRDALPREAAAPPVIEAAAPAPPGLPAPGAPTRPRSRP